MGILNGQRTIDNGTVQQSNNAFWGADGKWIVENHGADPDIVVASAKAYLAALNKLHANTDRVAAQG